MKQNIRFGQPRLMTLSEIGEELRPWSKSAKHSFNICKQSNFATPMRSLFPHLSPLGAVAGGCHDSSSPIELQKYAKAVRALAHLQGDFEALESGARARVFVNHTWLEAGTVFFERGGIAGAAVMGSDNVLLAFWMFFHAEVNQPHVRKNLELGARYMRRYSK